MKHIILLLWSLAAVVMAHAQPPQFQLSVRHDACGSGTGRVSATINSANPPLIAEWSTGVVTSGDTLDLEIVGLYAGVYSLTLTDNEGNSTTEDAEVLDMPGLQYQFNDQTITTCNASCGWRWYPLNVWQPSGVPPYTVEVGPPPATAAIYGNGQELNVGNLCPGQTYTVTLTDSNGCSQEWDIESTTISQPQLISQTITASCISGNNGSMELIYDVPTLFYISQWQGGSNAVVTYEAPNLVIVGNMAPGEYISHAFNAEYTFCYDTMFHTMPGTTTNCGFINGTLHADLNGDCTLDGGDVPLPYRMVDIQPGSQPAFTNAQGEYVKGVAYGTYTVGHTSEGFATICPEDPPVSVEVDIVNNTATVDFALVSLLGPDVGIQLWASPHAPGFMAQYQVHVTNTGPHPQTDITVELTYDPVLSELLVDPPAQQSQPGTVQWSIPSLEPFGVVQCSLYVEVPADPDLLGTTMTATVTLTAPLPDADPANDEDVVSVVVTGAYDPNDKQARTSSGLSDDLYLLDDDAHIDYTVRFQNTGSAPAEHVYILDTISPSFDLLSFQILATSHAFTASLLDDRVMRFDFPAIMLPDSASDPLGSQGFVRYRIRPKDPQPGAVLANAADIFFDFNPPIRTNTSELIVDLSTSVGSSAPEGPVVFPNPAQDLVMFRGMHTGRHLVEVLGMDGRSFLRRTIQGPDGMLSVASLAPGTYLLRAIAADGSVSAHRFVVAR